MNLIAAVYSDWGIGCCGTQPVVLKEDRKFFRETTRGAAVIVGRKTAEDFPGGKPLPGRRNLLLSRNQTEYPGFELCGSLEEVLRAVGEQTAFVIGGASIYAQLLPFCEKAYITKLDCCPESDAFLTDFDRDPEWQLEQCLASGEENGIHYQMLLYQKKK